VVVAAEATNQGIGDLQLQEQRKGGREGTADGKQQLQPRWKEGGEEAIYVLRVSTTESFFFSSLCSAEHDYTRQAKAHARLK
jgi:hypothetical protein